MSELEELESLYLELWKMNERRIIYPENADIVAIVYKEMDEILEEIEDILFCLHSTKLT